MTRMKEWASTGRVKPMPRGHTTVQELRVGRASASVFTAVHRGRKGTDPLQAFDKRVGVNM